jgi:hypothetical protein
MCVPQMQEFQAQHPMTPQTPQQAGIQAMQAGGQTFGPGGSIVPYNGPVDRVGGPSYAGAGSATTGGRVVYTNPGGYEVPDSLRAFNTKQFRDQTTPSSNGDFGGSQ